MTRIFTKEHSDVTLGYCVFGDRSDRGRGLGFGGLAGTAAGFAKILFLVFLVMFVLSLIFGRGRTPVV